MPHPYTRRQVLQGAGAALLSLGLLGPRLAIAEEGEAEAGWALEPARAATMTALVAALTLGPAAGVEPDAHAADFATFYATASPPFRELADGALDRLAPLTGMSVAEGYAALKDMTLDPTRQLDVADGLTLANLTFEAHERHEAGYFLATE